jgi:hypothetical protein
MAEKGGMSAEAQSSSSTGSLPADKKKRKEPRKIPGDFPYTTTPKKFLEILQAILKAERPPKFSGDFMATVLGFSGGTAAPVPPILKRVGMLNSDGSPTELYNSFRSNNGRSTAAYEALKRGYAELFKRNEYAHKLADPELRDLLVEVTGLNKNDSIISAIAGTFGALRFFIDPAQVKESPTPKTPSDVPPPSPAPAVQNESKPRDGIGLIYNINIELPNTDDPAVFNAIFKSLRDNLLR